MHPEITLYLSRHTCAMAPHIALLETGATFSTVHVDLNRGDQRRADFLALNPRAQVPVLKVGDEVVVENLAILVWIARQWPDAGLLPGGEPLSEIQALSWLSWCTGTLHPLFGRLFKPGYVVTSEPAVAEMQDRAREQIKGHFAEIEQRLNGREWAFGTFGVVDTFLFNCYYWAKQLELDIRPFPAFGDHYQRMLQRPSVTRMLETERTLARAA